MPTTYWICSDWLTFKFNSSFLAIPHDASVNFPTQISWQDKPQTKDLEVKLLNQRYVVTIRISSAHFSHSVMSDSLRPHGLKHTRLPCPSPTPGVYSNSCPWVGDDIQPSHPLSSPSPPTFNLSQHQGLSQWVSSFHQVAEVLTIQLQHQSFQWMFRTDLL